MEAKRQESVSVEAILTPVRPPRPLKELDPLTRVRLILLGAAAKSTADLSLEEASQKGADALRQAALPVRAMVKLSQNLLSIAPSGQTCLEAALFSVFAGVYAFAAAAQNTESEALKEKLNFLLVEQTDMLYRLSNLLILCEGTAAERLLGVSLEIMPGRPCAAQHRYPADEVASQPLTTKEERYVCYVLQALVRHEQSTTQFVQDPYGLGMELTLLLEQHKLFLKALAGGCQTDDDLLRARYLNALATEMSAEDENAAFSRAQKQTEVLLKKTVKAHEKKSRTPVELSANELPEHSFHLKPSKGYIRDALLHVGMTLSGGNLVPVGELQPGAPFFRYQRKIVPKPENTPSHLVIQEMLQQTGSDYRYEIAEHPIEALRERRRDHLDVGR